MAGAVILIIASVGSRISGSGTVSTRTSFLPCQQSAFIKISSFSFWCRWANYIFCPPMANSSVFVARHILFR